MHNVEHFMMTSRHKTHPQQLTCGKAACLEMCTESAQDKQLEQCCFARTETANCTAQTITCLLDLLPSLTLQRPEILLTHRNLYFAETCLR